MRMLLAILLLLVSSQPCAAASQLLMAVYEHDAWLRVTPTLMLYDDGTLLYAPLPAGSGWLRRQVADPARWLAERLSNSLQDDQRDYRVTNVDHAITTVVWTRGTSLSVFGDWRRPPEIVKPESLPNDPRWAELGRSMNEQQRALWSRLPPVVRQTLTRLEQERAQGGEAWASQEVELKLQPVDAAQGDFPSWPSDWPNHLVWATRLCNDEEAYTLRLPASLTAPLHRLLELNPKEIVVINGRKMRINAHAVLPNEAQWLPACVSFLSPPV